MSFRSQIELFSSDELLPALRHFVSLVDNQLGEALNIFKKFHKTRLNVMYLVLLLNKDGRLMTFLVCILTETDLCVSLCCSSAT